MDSQRATASLAELLRLLPCPHSMSFLAWTHIPSQVFVCTNPRRWFQQCSTSQPASGLQLYRPVPHLLFSPASVPPFASSLTYSHAAGCTPFYSTCHTSCPCCYCTAFRSALSHILTLHPLLSTCYTSCPCCTAFRSLCSQSTKLSRYSPLMAWSWNTTKS